MIIWDKVFTNGPNKICGRQPLKNFTWSILEYFVSFKTKYIPVGIYLLKVNNRNTRTRCEICSKLS